jgi:hypothetical protein
MDNGGWTDVAGVVAAAASTLVALVAVVVAIRSDRRSREVIKVQTYLALRGGFLSIYRELGRLEDVGTDDVGLDLARAAYWHHAWDEWYVSERLAPREFGDLWRSFFSVAVVAGLRHPALRARLDTLASDENAGFGAYAKDFVEVLRQIDDGARGTVGDARAPHPEPH